MAGKCAACLNNSLDTVAEVLGQVTGLVKDGLGICGLVGFHLMSRVEGYDERLR